MSSSSLSRRGFLGLAAAGTAATALPGCGGGSSGSSTIGQPRSGGRLRAAFSGGGAAEVLDPHQTNLYVEIARTKALYDKLADYGSDMAPQPRLAEKWEPSADLRTWRITLRQATFHNGQPVRPADVLASFARIVEPGSTRRAKSALSVIDLANSRAIGDRTIEFRLERPYGEFPNALATLGTYIAPSGTPDLAKPVGSGPFRFRSFEPGRSFVAERNPDYWDGAPYIEELQLLISNDEAARVNALLGKQVEYAHDLTPTSARTHEKAVRIHRLPLSNFHGLAMKVDRPPFNQPELRQAMFHLIDRDELIRSVLHGSGELGNDLYGKNYRYYAAGLAQRGQDLDRAKALLKQAGAEGLTIDFDTSDASTGLKEAALAISDQARAIGLNLNVKLGNKDTYWADIAKNGVLAGYRSGAMPLESHISQRLLTTSTTNNTQWRRPDFDKLYYEAQSTTDEDERADLYLRMQQQLFDDGGFLWWGVSDWIVASAPAVGGVDDKAPANTLNWARFDKVWLA
ncbi:ABC transporter substrate-binding protein [Kribbella sp. NPDC050124]|uniref:ABC transporter substrate-binding protein n=1 Tax=Kribbella sp. NPDC050124 TaxID=3364114 RepID=UPI00378EF643